MKYSTRHVLNCSPECKDIARITPSVLQWKMPSNHIASANAYKHQLGFMTSCHIIALYQTRLILVNLLQESTYTAMKIRFKDNLNNAEGKLNNFEII